MDFNEEDWNFSINQNNKMKIPKISIISKLRWRLSYAECYKKFGYDVSKMNLLLNNPNMAKYYRNNKEKIHKLLETYEQTLSTDSSELFNVILQSIQRGSTDKVIRKIENYIAQINRIKGDKDYNIKGNSIVKTEQNKFLEFLKKGIIDLQIDNLEKDDDHKEIEQYNENINFVKCIQELYGENANEVLIHYNGLIDKLNKTSNSILNDVFLKTLIEKTKIFCKDRLQKKTSIETIDKYVNIICQMSDYTKINSNNYGENVRNAIIENIEDIEFYYGDYGFEDTMFLESNDSLNSCIHFRNIPLEKAINMRRRFFDARIKDEMQEGNIEKVKELVCKKYFGITEDDLPIEIENLSERSKKAINCIKKINNSNTYTRINEIIALLDRSEFRQFDNEVVNDISNALKHEFRSKLFDVNNIQPTKYVEYEGKSIPMIILKGEDFRGIIHAAIDSSRIESFEGSTGHLCTSEQSDKAYRFFNNGIAVGFSNLSNEELYYNQATTGMGTGSVGSSKGKKMYLDTLSFKRDAVEETSEIAAINEIDIKPKKPDYVFSMSTEDMSKKLNIAAKLGIPIVIMDTDSYYQKYESLYQKKQEYFEHSQKKYTLEDFKELCVYDRQRSAFKIGDSISSVNDNSSYRYINFFILFRNIKRAQENPSFYNDVFNYITRGDPQRFEELKKYILDKLIKDDEKSKEKVSLWFEKLDEIRQKYLKDRETESQTI